MKELQPSFKKILQPYILITIAGLLAFAPVSFMLRSLKNDVIALEYPINHFMSQCIHNGKLPYWFNTWGLGFPLQSNLTWGIFSTPQMLFCSIFNYNIYILHIEFMFFVLLAGWSMFHLLSKYVVKDKSIAQLMAISYMLSGFMVGSTQWLLYITAASFIPIVISSLLKLLHTPSFKNALQFGVVYTMMFTSVYAAFNIITTYSLVIFILIWILQLKKSFDSKLIVLKYLGLAGAITLLFCLPCLYFTIELLKNIDRGSAIISDTTFFNSNYLHPSALSSMLLPFSSVKMGFSNTEGTMLNTYSGLFSLLTLPAAVWWLLKEKNKSAFFLLLTAIFFLLVSFGQMTPLRNALNVMPGFSYFRNPSIFRFYFLLSLFLFIGAIFSNRSFKEVITLKQSQYSIGVFLIICTAVFFLNFNKSNWSISPIGEFIKNITLRQTLLINCLIQLLILIAISFLIRTKWFVTVKLIFTADLIINTLICTPFFSVSNYSIPEVSHILHSVSGFPVQVEKPALSAATYTDYRNNVWNNVNIFHKEISTNDTYRGPLTLNNYYAELRDSSKEKTGQYKSFVFAGNDSASLEISMQSPTHIRALLRSTRSTIVTVMQNNYPGWKAFYNNKEIEIIHDNKQGMSVMVPEGTGTIDFRYERISSWLFAFLLHLFVLSYLLRRLLLGIKKIIHPGFKN